MRPQYNNTYVTLKGNHICESSSGLAVKFCVREINGVALFPTKTEWFPYSQLSKTFTDTKAPEGSVNTDWIMASTWILDQKGISYALDSDPKPHQQSNAGNSPAPVGSKAEIQNTFDSFDDDIPF